MPSVCTIGASGRVNIRHPGTNSFAPLSTLSTKSKNDETERANRKCQEQWAEGMRRFSQSKVREVAVLLFSWKRDQEHSMNTENELRDLKAVFEDKYNFTVQTELLSTQSEQQPRYQLTRILIDFLSKYDQPGTLVIIYYGGHGMLSNSGEELRLLGGNPFKKDYASTELNWNDVEPTLHRIRADLLLVFDCCYAGFVARDRRKWPPSQSHFEFIGSTAHDKTARGPKDAGSFTRAMIGALHDLATEKKFTPDSLTRKIIESPVFRETQQHPVVSACGKENSFARLNIMPRPKKTIPSNTSKGQAINFYLNLKYVFQEQPTEEHLHALIERLRDIVNNDRVPIADVLYEGLSEYNPRMSMADAGRMLLARIRKQRCRDAVGQLEISAGAGEPNLVLERTLTNLTMDDGIPISSSVDERTAIPIPIPQKGRNITLKRPKLYRIATLPFFIRPFYRFSNTTTWLSALVLLTAVLLSHFYYHVLLGLQKHWLAG